MSKDIHLQLEALLRSHLDSQRAALIAAVERIYARGPTPSPRQHARGATPRASAARPRRAEAELKGLAERLHAVVEADPGIGMTRIAATIGVPPRELERPMIQLKLARRVRSVGRRQSTRYFPMTA